MVLVIHYSDVIIDAIAVVDVCRGGPKIIVTPLAETYVGSELRHHCCCCSRDRQTDRQTPYRRFPRSVMARPRYNC